MTLYITEHGQVQRLAGMGAPVTLPILSTLAAYSLSSLSTAPFPQAGAQYIRVTADAGMFMNLNNATTGVALGSSNAFRIPAGVAPELFAVSTAMRINSQST